jgi:hypothetical protein
MSFQWLVRFWKGLRVGLRGEPEPERSPWLVDRDGRVYPPVRRVVLRASR